MFWWERLSSRDIPLLAAGKPLPVSLVPRDRKVLSKETIQPQLGYYGCTA